MNPEENLRYFLSVDEVNDIFNKDPRNLNYTKHRVLSQLYPLRSKQFNCTLLLATNLAYPEWININCDDPILSHTVCFFRNGSIDTPNIDINPLKESCIKTAFLKNGMCYLFVWFYKQNISRLFSACSRNRMITHSIKDITTFNFLFDAYKQKSIVILSPKYLSNNQLDYKFMHRFKIERFWLKLQFIKRDILVKEVEGFFICKGIWVVLKTQVTNFGIFSEIFKTFELFETCVTLTMYECLFETILI